MPSQNEIERRYKNIRAAMETEKVDALIVCGNQYAGFEGAVRYMSGFEIVHRYVYVLIPLSSDPVLVFPREARWIGDKKAPFVQEKVWAEIPGKWLRDEIEKRHWKRVAVYGMEFIMAVRDYRELQGQSFELVPFDFHFDMARAVKSEEELEGFRDSMDIILDGFRALLAAYEPGKTEAEIMAPAVERFFARGAGPRMMNIVLSGTDGEAEAFFKVPSLRKVSSDDLLLYSLEITGAAGYWIEFSRALIRGKISPRTQAMSEVYPHALEAARVKMRDGMLASEVHKAAADVFRTAKSASTRKTPTAWARTKASFSPMYRGAFTPAWRRGRAHERQNLHRRLRRHRRHLRRPPRAPVRRRGPRVRRFAGTCPRHQ